MDRILNVYAEDAFRSTGLTPSYAFILLALYERDGLPQKELARILQLAPSTLTRFIEKLMHKGLVTGKCEGRNTYVFLTKEGRALSPELQSAWEALHGSYVDVIPCAEADALAERINDAGERLKTAREKN